MQPDQFLAARVAEAKQPCVCLEGANGACGGPWCREDCRPCSGGDAYTSDEHVLATLEGYERILERHEALGGYVDTRDVAAYLALEGVIIDLAHPWKHHPDWDPQWEVG